MSNVKDNGLFNLSLKKEFLDDINEETRANYRRILRKTCPHEKALNKDVSQFNLDEIETVLRSFKTTSRNTVESYGRIISAYLNWCVKSGKISKNVMADLKPEDFDRFIVEEDYITEYELRQIEDQCVNYQDSVIIRLLFSGLGGKTLSEIRNLKIDDVDFDKKRLRLVNTLKEDDLGFPIRFTERYISVDDRTLKLIQGAIDQETYVKSNGEKNLRAAYTTLVKNDYVIGASLTQTDMVNEPVDKFVVYRRLTTIEEAFDLSRFTPKFIQQSGMIYYAKNLIEGDVLQKDDMRMTANQFGNASYHSIKGIVTMNNIKRLYPEHFEGESK